MKTIGILGSTGSIGEQTLEVVRQHPEEYRVSGLAVMGNIEKLYQQMIEFRPGILGVYNPEKARELKDRIREEKIPDPPKVYAGLEGLIAIAASQEISLLVNAVVGSVGLVPTIKGIEAGKDIALANKETLVVAGELVMKKVREHGVTMTPIDSEHSAIFQCLQGEDAKSLKKIILTASGGPFRSWKREDIQKATFREALKHPNWDMGRKISIDSATMMNKGLEVIEAKWLFDVEAEQIDTIVHPQSIIHSMVEFHDTSVIAQLGVPDMKVPIQYALSYPKRLKAEYETLDLRKVATLHFEEADHERFPCLELAYDALKTGGTMPAVLNGANEVLVDRYLRGEIPFYGISDGILRTMDAHQAFQYKTMEEILEVDQWSRDYAGKASG